MKHKTLIFFSVFIFRILNSLYIKTYFDPDEYWQAQEVAHRLVFGYGYLTWEWSLGLRGILYPGMMSGAYWLVKVLGLEETEMMIVAPKVFQAFFTCLTDIFTYALASKLFGDRIGRWSLFCSVTSFFNAYAGVRTFSNSIETTFTTIALYYYSSLFLSLLLAGISCMLRPTSAIIWLAFGIQHILVNRKSVMSIMGMVVLTGYVYSVSPFATLPLKHAKSFKGP
jgi:phosphatidylinositol glycan class B